MSDAKDFARPASEGTGFRFGLGNAQTAARLRHLADEIEIGVLAVQKVRFDSVAGAEDWAVTKLVIEFADQDIAVKRKIAAERKDDVFANALYGTGANAVALPPK